jgi:hypothetical protein
VRADKSLLPAGTEYRDRIHQTCSITSSVPDGDGFCRQAMQFFAGILTDFKEN